jgi:hypothetical protein
MANQQKLSRIKIKDELSQRHYGTSYAGLCSDRKRVIDQLYLVGVVQDDEIKMRKCK